MLYAPIERLTYINENFTLIRINKDYPIVNEKISNKTICFNENVIKIFEDLLK